MLEDPTPDTSCWPPPAISDPSSSIVVPTQFAIPSSPIEPPPLLLRPRREVFEYGLLPIPALILSDGTSTLSQLKCCLLSRAVPRPYRVSASDLAEGLQIATPYAELFLDTLATILPERYPELPDVAGEADLRDVLLLLYIQTYKRLVHRVNKDSPAVNDVRPSTSAFDGYLSVLSPIQLVRSNTRRLVPSQADEEAHLLSYLQKHMANILTLLADSIEGESDESAVLTKEAFEHLGFLMQYSGGDSLIHAAPFFTNSETGTHAATVSVAEVHDWVMQNIAASLECTSEKSAAKDNCSPVKSNTDETMAVANNTNPRSPCSNSPSDASGPHDPVCFKTQIVEGFSKTSVVRQSSDIQESSIKVLNCYDSVIYLLAPLKYATVYGCSDATVVLGPVGKVVKVEHCERVQIIVAAKRITIANCRECVFYLGVNNQPVIMGDNHKIQVAPFNTYYGQLGDHMALACVDSRVNRWDQLFVLGMVDPHDSLSHPAGLSDVQAESATLLDPDLFADFVIPSWFCADPEQTTRYNPFPLPDIYLSSLQRKNSVLADIQKSLQMLDFEENKKRDLASTIHAQFKDWLYASGNIRQLYCLRGD